MVVATLVIVLTVGPLLPPTYQRSLISVYIHVYTANKCGLGELAQKYEKAINASIAPRGESKHADR